MKDEAILMFTGFLIIFGRLSDIFGRKQSLLLALGFFTVWSAACGWSGSIEQLYVLITYYLCLHLVKCRTPFPPVKYLAHLHRIVFRALQGIGGSGIYALCLTAVTEITPLEYMSYASGAVSGIALSASILGPVLGGVITSGGDGMWRWVFWLKYEFPTYLSSHLLMTNRAAAFHPAFSLSP
jgi:MFS family permease